MTFKRHPSAISLLSLFPLIFYLPAAHAQLTLGAYDPTVNDHLVGQVTLSDGSTTSLTGNQQFVPGVGGAVNTTIGTLNGNGDILSGYDAVVDAARLTYGSRNYAITIPDPITGSPTTYSVYNTANIVDVEPVTDSTTLSDIVNVNNQQYIDARVATVTSGTLDVNIGQSGAQSTAGTNSWSMAAKQSTLFEVDGSAAASTLNWGSNNRVTFFGSVADLSSTRTFSINNLVTYAGAINVNTLDGQTYSTSVNSSADLQVYNDWLISQLQTGNLATSSYVNLFKQAFTTTSGTIEYTISATPPDEVFEPYGSDMLIHATGANASVNVLTGQTLEVGGSTGGVINAGNGATVVNDGKIAGTGGAVLVLTDATGTNNGVINSGFFNNANGTGVSNVTGSGPAVQVQGSTFNNTGVINLAATGTNQAINLGNSSTATNSGDINVGVNGSSASGALTGVLVDSTSSFTNQSNGTIYIGRGPENAVGEGAADTAINQDSATSGIQAVDGGVAINNGAIVIGSKAQNAAGMYADGGDNTTLINNGTIDVKGAAAAVPNQNVGMAVINAGSGGNIVNNGAINLTGVNGIGIYVNAQSGQTANVVTSASSNIVVAGGADPASGTRNYGIWVEGDDTGVATATVDGSIHLTGNGAIAVHARGNATVNVSNNAIPTFDSGSNQIAFFAYGPDAKIIADGSVYDVTTTGSILFVMAQGASYDGTAQTLTASGNNSIAIYGSGKTGSTATLIDTKDAQITVSGTGATGLVVEGGAQGNINAATTINLTGANSVGAIVDGQGHNLSGTPVGTPDNTTQLNSFAGLSSSQNGLTGYIARNQATLTNIGSITFTGSGATGILVQSGATANNSNVGAISINDGGIGILVNSGNGLVTTANNFAFINVNGGSLAARTIGASASGANAIVNLAAGSNVIMNGVGAIGAQAVDGGVVNASISSVPLFQNTDQIAFYARGEGSTINSGAASTNASTDRSTIYWIENGADLSLPTAGTLTASAQGSQAIVGSGPGTNINADQKNFLASGEQARLVTIMGGAQGVLGSGSTLTLNGQGSIGGIADGQQRNISGANVGSPNAATLLTSAGTLTSNTANAYGYLATNAGQVVNSGSMTMNGAGNVGMQAQRGGTVTNSGTVTMALGDGIGLIATSSSGDALTTAVNDGSIDINGGSLAQRAQAILATGSQSRANLTDNSQITLNSVGDIGVNALNGAQVNVTANGNMTLANTDQIGFHAQGTGSAITSALSTFDVNTDRSVGYRADAGGVVNFTSPAAMQLSGNSVTGVVVSGFNSRLNSQAIALNVNGNAATGIRVEGGASASLNSGDSIQLNGTDVVGMQINNQATDINNVPNGQTGASSAVSQASVSGASTGAIAYLLENGGALVHSGSVNLSGSSTIGVAMRNGGTLMNTGVIHVNNGTGIDVSGVGSGPSSVQAGSVFADDGVAGVRLSNGAQLALSGANSFITAAGTAHGILLDTGAAALGANGLVINVNGSGNGLENGAEISQVGLQNVTVNSTDGSGIRTAVTLAPASAVTLNVGGSGVGFNFTQSNGALTSHNLALNDGYRINVTGAGGTGIRANTTGTVVTAAPVTIYSPQGGSALVAGTASATLNQGTLLSFSQQAPVVDLSNGSGTTFTNQGLVSGLLATSTAIKGSAGPDVILLPGGGVVGDVNTGDGDDIVQWTGGRLRGSLTLGPGNANQALVQSVDLSQTLHITSEPGENNQLTFANIQARGASLAADDLANGTNLGQGWSTINFTNNTQWTLSGNLQLGHSTVNIDNSSTLFVEERPSTIILGASPNSVVVNNAGVIDMTVGRSVLRGPVAPAGRRLPYRPSTDSLTIQGHLVSSNGQVNMISTLNQGGSLSNQVTQRLLIEGNAEGTTYLNVNPSLLSNGALTDLNRNSAVDSNEGISLVQVAGNANSNSFALSSGTLSAGPWAYKLYNFAPGQSDPDTRVVGNGSGSTHWDYRLANAYVCQGETTCTPQPPGLGKGRPAVTPQVPSYISSIVGLANYNAVSIDDLHKRLGEVRHEDLVDPSRTEDFDKGEAYVRYIGSDLKYKSNVGFADYGYDFDMKYDAVQIGADLLRIKTDRDSLRAGVAYIYGNGDIRPDAADGFSRQKLRMDTYALYLTWQKQNGFYIDGALAYNKSKGHVDVDGYSQIADLSGSSWIISAETGYPFNLNDAKTIKLEPQLQLMYQRFDMDDIKDANGAVVRYDNSDYLIGRLGARLYRTWDDEKQQKYTPYLRVNYYHGWGDGAKVTIGQDGISDLDHTFTGGEYGQAMEVGLGGTATFRNNFSIYGEVSYRHELSEGSSGWFYNLGARWVF